MTIEEVAQYLQLSRDTVYKFAQKGKIPASKIGKQWRFKRDEIDSWVKNEQRPANKVHKHKWSAA